jgi:hypothetical protein
LAIEAQLKTGDGEEKPFSNAELVKSLYYAEGAIV